MPYTIVQLEQGSDEWKQWRKTGITATDAVVINGMSPYKSEWRLYAEKKGIAIEPDLSRNPLVRRGNFYEDAARDHMADFLLEHDPSPEVLEAANIHLKEVLTPHCIQMKKYPMLRASLDGMRNNGEPTELKVPSERTFEDVLKRGRDSKAYRLYYPQVQHQIMVAGADRGWLLFFQPDQDVTPICFEVLRDRGFIKNNVALCAAFFKKLSNNTPPEKNEEKDVYYPEDADQAEAWFLHAPVAYRLEKHRRSLKKQLDAIDAQLSEHKAALAVCMGGFMKGEYGGIRLSRSERKGAVDWQRMIEAEAGLKVTDDLKDAYRKGSGSETHRLTITEKGMPREILDDNARQWLEGLVDEEGFVDYPLPKRSGYF